MFHIKKVRSYLDVNDSGSVDISDTLVCDLVAFPTNSSAGRPRLKCDGTRAETTFRLSAKRMSPFKSAGASVQSTTGSRSVRIGGSNAVYSMF